MARLRPYATPWSPGPDDTERFRSAVALAEFAVSSPDLTSAHRSRLLNESIWYATEGGGKYKTRYRSRGVLDLEKEAPLVNWWSYLRHEHVVTRSSLKQRILDGEPAADVLADAVACVVTAAEHERLSRFDNTHNGWARYEMAAVEVVDMADGSTLAFPTVGR